MDLHSQSLGALAKALALVQAEMKPAPKTSTNPFFKSHYADLTSCLETALPVLSKHGLSVSQTTTVEDSNTTLLVTMLLHESGEWIRGFYPILSKDNSPQAIGSAVSYAKRYAFCAIIGLASGDDDDAETASKRPPDAKERAAIASNSNWVGGPTEAQIKRLWAISKASGWTKDDVRHSLDELGLDSTAKLNKLQYEKLCDNMQKYPKGFGNATTDQVPT